MKNKILLSLLILSLCSFYIQGAQKDNIKNQKYYSVNSKFFVGTEDSVNSEGKKTMSQLSSHEFKVGKDVTLTLKIDVNRAKRWYQHIPFLSGERADNFIDAELIIPKITAVEAKYYNGPLIEYKVDNINNVTTYFLKIRMPYKKEIIDNTFGFKFTPNAAADISMDLIFDDNISDIYDRFITLKFVE